jgi:hypothetical protein
LALDKPEPTGTRLPEVRELAAIRKIEGLKLGEKLIEVLEADVLEKFEVQGIEELELVEIQVVGHREFD